MTRQRSAGARAALENARLCIEEERRERFWPDAGRVWRAIMLAPTLAVCEALLRGESVPVDRLDPDQATRFGIAKRRAA